MDSDRGVEAELVPGTSTRYHTNNRYVQVRCMRTMCRSFFYYFHIYMDMTHIYFQYFIRVTRLRVIVQRHYAVIWYQEPVSTIVQVLYKVYLLLATSYSTVTLICSNFEYLHCMHMIRAPSTSTSTRVLVCCMQITVLLVHSHTCTLVVLHTAYCIPLPVDFE